MTITLGNIRITILKIETLRPEPLGFAVDREQTKRDADAIKNSESFRQIKERAAQIRASRQ